MLRSAYIAWLTVCLIWGTTYLGIRIALETIPPALVGGIRYAIAGTVLAAILLARGERPPARAHWRGLALLGEYARGLIIRRIVERDYAPNAPSTIVAKGSDTPLVDEGILKGSIAYKVEQ